MKKLNFDKLMALNPTMYDKVVNQLGQLVEFYEHPLRGDEAPVIAVITSEKIAVETDFFDTCDMYEGSEYLPVFMGGKVECAYNFYLV